MKITIRNKGLSVPVLAMTLVLASCGADLTPEQYLERAESAVAVGDLDAALIDLKSAARAAPNNLEARRQLALLYLDLGLGAEAEKEVRRASELGIPDNEAALLLSKSLMLKGDYEGLLKESDEFAGEPDAAIQSEILAYRAQALMKLGDYRLAATMIDVALELQPDSPLALATKSSLEALGGNLERARNWADHALEVDPQSPDAWAMMGDILVETNDLDGALAAYDKAIANRSFVTMVNARRAMLLLRLGEFDKAEADIALLEQAGLGEVGYVRQVKGTSAFLQQDFSVAAELFERGLEASPKNLTMQVYLAASLLELKTI